MSFFNFIKNIFRLNNNPPEFRLELTDKADWAGDDFEFLIAGDIQFSNDFDDIMTPNSIAWTKATRDDGDYYQIGVDEYSYSMEEPGIQMTFNKEISFAKAKMIADEVIANIKATGQQAELIILDRKNVYRFD